MFFALVAALTKKRRPEAGASLALVSARAV